jgi:N6-L-threonylcarbamoyladenine synthase
MKMAADYSRGTPPATGATATGLTVLGLETSCDETAASVVHLSADGQATVLSSVIHSQIDDHAAFGGVVPEIAARSHVEMIAGVTARAMTEAGLDYAALDGVAATAGPGLVGGVMVGLSFGKAAALARGLPFIGVNHLEGHAVSARLARPVDYPFLLLLVSGGHCQLLDVQGIGNMSRLGTTIDDAAGEAFDKIAKSMGLGYPGGPALENLARSGDASRHDLPRALLGRKDCDFSFSGLKTAASRLAQACQSDQDRADLAAAVQNAIARQLCERSARAMGAFLGETPQDGSVQSLGESTPSRARPLFVVAGGVAANQTIRAELEKTASRHGFDFLAPPMAYCTDNAAMIALAGAERLALGLTSELDMAARPRWPLDEARALADPVHKAGRKGAKA